jgi:molecular chaperone DnaK
VKDAESHAEEDKQRREEVEARNRLDALTYEVEKNSKEWEDKLDQATKDRMNGAVEAARKALKQGDLSEIRAAAEELQQAYSAAGAQIYQAQQSAAGDAGDAGFSGGATAGAGFEGDATAQAEGRPADEDVVEADYEIVEEEKK